MTLIFQEFMKPVKFEIMMQHQIFHYFSYKEGPGHHQRRILNFQCFITTRFNCIIDFFHEKLKLLFHSVENQHFYFIKCWFSFFRKNIKKYTT